MAGTNPVQRLQVTGQIMRLMVEQEAGEFRLRDVTLDGYVRCAVQRPKQLVRCKTA